MNVILISVIEQHFKPFVKENWREICKFNVNSKVSHEWCNKAAMQIIWEQLLIHISKKMMWGANITSWWFWRRLCWSYAILLLIWMLVFCLDRVVNFCSWKFEVNSYWSWKFHHQIFRLKQGEDRGPLSCLSHELKIDWPVSCINSLNS